MRSLGEGWRGEMEGLLHSDCGDDFMSDERRT